MRIVVVGAGVSGAHAALTLLERGHAVELWDVGRAERAVPEAGATFHGLKERLADPVGYLLGQDLEALVPPDAPELMRYPPSRAFLASAQDPLWPFVGADFVPFASFAKGGLANGWGANALSYDDDDLAGWPVSAADMDQAYRTVYRRIPVAGPGDDDLSPYLSGVHPSQAPVRLSAADERLMRSYARRRKGLARLGVHLGAARLAVVTDPQHPDACDHCERCLWGCPRGSIYNPAASTLVSCEAHKGYRYVPGRQVLALAAADGRIKAVRFLDTASREVREEPCDAVFLAAGALQTGAVFLRTLRAAGVDVSLETEGLLDTTVVKVPYVALGSVGRPPEERTFQFNRLMMGMVRTSDVWPRYLHGEVMHLTSLLYHPLIERMPFDSRLSTKLFFALRPALGAVSLFFPDRISPGNRQVLLDRGTDQDPVELCYRDTDDKEDHIRQSIGTVRAALLRLGCIPKGTARSPAGGGIHYAGTVPMGAGPKRCSASGRSNLFPNLYIADGAAFPSLPSKSITLSLAAHATRVALNAAL